jgi:two-component system, chemotaxis family, sensor kinase CheA
VSDLAEQFLIEARELLAQAEEDFVALERGPADAARLDRLFRAVHTLKGSAGIVELPAMARLMHAAEEILGDWRDGRATPTSASIDWTLASLDHTQRWLDRFEASGELGLEAEREASALIALLPDADIKAGSEPPAKSPDWAERMLASVSPSTTTPLLALEYVPRSGCFFDGDDPLDLMRRLPGLLALDLGPRESWPPPDRSDPFSCNLRIRALADVPVAEAQTLFRMVSDQVWTRQVERPRPPPGPPKEGLLAQLLSEQRYVLEAAEEGSAIQGRLASVARVAANALRHTGAEDRAVRVEAAGLESLALNSPRPLLKAMGDGASAGEAADAPATSNVSIRVDAARMDQLVDLVGEIVIARNSLSQLARRAEAGLPPAEVRRELKERADAMERLTTLLQQDVLRMRLMSVAPVFRRFPRLIRETARSLGKSVALVIAGEETETDKSVLDMLFEPLVHLVRNALDHGIEMPDERKALGKPVEGVLSLTARQSGDRVVIEVSDDGRGLDEQRIRRAAVARGLLSEEAASALAEAEALQLVFQPGFSTASSVSDLSGRGVGMDAVRTAVEGVGGHVHLSSRPGQGTTCQLELPIGLAVTRVIVVRVGAERFGLPMSRSTEALDLPRQDIHSLPGGAVFVHRGKTLPLVLLSDLLGVPQSPKGDLARVLLISSRHGSVGLAVDGLDERLDVLLRPPEGLLATMPALLGTTLLGNGCVLLVLDPEELLA